MKKSNKKAKSLKRYKEDLNIKISEDNLDDAIKICNGMIKDYPKNVYGYDKKIELITNNYSKYIDVKLLKELKELNEVRLTLTTKKNYDKVKTEFDEYLNDLNEVSNLQKVKKELVAANLKKELYQDKITYLNNLLNDLDKYRIDGKRILNIYDLIKGLFLSFCLIFNLFNINYLLLLTVPFGIYGFIIIYSFLSTNLSKSMLIKKNIDNFNTIISGLNEKVEQIKKEIVKLDENIEFNINQKNTSILRLPKLFKEDLEDLYLDNEKNICSNLKNLYVSNRTTELKEELIKNTNLTLDDYNSFIKDLDDLNDEAYVFINDKLLERKNSREKLIIMKDVKTWNIILMIILLIISDLSIIVISFNFYDLNFKSFIIALITGIISMLIYNINKGKSSSLIDTFNDNLISCIFNSTLIYNLIYASITNDLRISYNFIEIPIIFILIFIGFVMFISYLKYNNLKRKLRN